MGKLKYKWGVFMDFAIRNLKSGKILFREIKRQDGWTETTSIQQGRGNAHERNCKYLALGLMRLLRKTGGLSEEIFHFDLLWQETLQKIPGAIERLPIGFRNIQETILCGEILVILVIF